MTKTILLVEERSKFSKDEINELEVSLSKLPSSHLKSIDIIKKIPYLGSIAESSPEAKGEEIRLSDYFFNLNQKIREFALFHEIGHNYFDYIDEWKGDFSCLPKERHERANVSHLLRVQWMELGEWELNERIWSKIQEKTIEESKNKYGYITKREGMDYNSGEWVSSRQGKFKSFRKLGFRYDEPFYTPKEEMADAYALFVINNESFEKQAKKSDLIKGKYNFIANCFKDNSRENIVFTR